MRTGMAPDPSIYSRGEIANTVSLLRHIGKDSRSQGVAVDNVPRLSHTRIFHRMLCCFTPAGIVEDKIKEVGDQFWVPLIYCN